MEVGNRNCGEEDCQFLHLNRLLLGHFSLNSHKARIDKKITKLCEKCHQPEATNHYLFQCESYKEERETLETVVEDILKREGLNDIGDIDQ